MTSARVPGEVIRCRAIVPVPGKVHTVRCPGRAVHHGLCAVHTEPPRAVTTHGSLVPIVAAALALALGACGTVPIGPSTHAGTCPNGKPPSCSYGGFGCAKPYCP